MKVKPTKIVAFKTDSGVVCKACASFKDRWKATQIIRERDLKNDLEIWYCGICGRRVVDYPPFEDTKSTLEHQRLHSPRWPPLDFVVDK
jgi:hypothetical protein